MAPPPAPERVGRAGGSAPWMGMFHRHHPPCAHGCGTCATLRSSSGEERKWCSVRRLLAVLTSLFVLSGCGGAQTASDTAGSGGTSTPVSSELDTTSQPDATTSEITAAPAASEALTLSSDASTEMVATPSFPDSAGQRISLLTAVEAGRHEGFDRVVWTFDGDVPAYRVAYVERPITEDGSGAPIEVRGDATLQIILTPASGTDLSGEDVRTIYEGPDRIDGSGSGTSVVEEVVLTGDFEATLSWVIGLDRQAPFTVTELADPTRVVIDIASG
jgi:hypothetical protein